MKNIFLSINSDPSISANLLTHRCLQLPVKESHTAASRKIIVSDKAMLSRPLPFLTPGTQVYLLWKVTT